MPNVLLTIAIPNYNGAGFIASAIRSCGYLALPANDHEILVMDNASTDNSVDVVQTLKEDFPALRLIVNETNMGRLLNWKKCINEAKGKYIHFLNVTDEFYENNNIAEQLCLLENDPSISMTISSYIARYSENKDGIGNDFFDKDLKIKSPDFIISCINRGLYPFGILSSKLMRVDDIRRINFNDKYPASADAIFASEAALKREYVYFTKRKSIVWGICKNTNRFSANTTIEKLISGEIDAVSEITNMIKSDRLRWGKFYAAEILGVLYFKLYLSNLVSPQSSYSGTIKYLFEKAKENKIGKITILRYFVMRIVELLFKKMTHKDNN